MKKYFKRKFTDDSSQLIIKKNHVKINYTNLPANLRFRLLIWNYNVNIKDEIRRICLQKNLYQSRNHNFPHTKDDVQKKKFNPKWFEYNVKKN